jgi:hypothetical protein
MSTEKAMADNKLVDRAAEERKLNALLVELDERHFRGELRAAGWRCLVEPLRPKHFGEARRDRRQVVIAEHCLADVPEARGTLLHEMIHAWLFITGDPSHQGRNESHGATFAAEIARLAAAGEDVSSEWKYVTCGDKSPERTQVAADAYLARQRGTERPAGKCDAGGRWFPAPTEWQICCAGIRTPSRNWPNELRKHCCSITHISRLHGVDTVALRDALARAKGSAKREVPPEAGTAATLPR